MAKGESAPSLDALTIEPAEYPIYLTAVYDDTKLPDKPRNAIGFAKEIPPADMESLLLASYGVDDESLRALANRRAETVKEWFAGREASRRSACSWSRRSSLPMASRTRARRRASISRFAETNGHAPRGDAGRFLDLTRVGGARQHDVPPEAAQVTVLRFHRTLVRVDDQLGDGKAKSGARSAAVARALDAEATIGEPR